jgi:hypothetical protein
MTRHDLPQRDNKGCSHKEHKGHKGHKKCRCSHLFSFVSSPENPPDPVNPGLGKENREWRESPSGRANGGQRFHRLRSRGGSVGSRRTAAPPREWPATQSAAGGAAGPRRPPSARFAPIRVHSRLQVFYPNPARTLRHGIFVANFQLAFLADDTDGFWQIRAWARRRRPPALPKEPMLGNRHSMRTRTLFSKSVRIGGICGSDAFICGHLRHLRFQIHLGESQFPTATPHERGSLR